MDRIEVIFEENEDERSENPDPLRYERITSIRKNTRPKLYVVKNGRDERVSFASAFFSFFFFIFFFGKGGILLIYLFIFLKLDEDLVKITNFCV